MCERKLSKSLQHLGTFDKLVVLLRKCRRRRRQSKFSFSLGQEKSKKPTNRNDRGSILKIGEIKVAGRKEKTI